MSNSNRFGNFDQLNSEQINTKNLNAEITNASYNPLNTNIGGTTEKFLKPFNIASTVITPGIGNFSYTTFLTTMINYVKMAEAIYKKYKSFSKMWDIISKNDISVESSNFKNRIKVLNSIRSNYESSIKNTENISIISFGEKNEL